MTRLVAAAGILCCACVTTAAPVRSPAPSPSPSPSPTAPRLAGTFSVTGAARFTTTFTAPAMVEVDGSPAPAPAGSTCADYAKGYEVDGGRGFDAPEVHTAAVGHLAFFVSVTMPGGYAGPGTYDGAQYPSLQGYASQDVENPTGVATTPFTAGAAGTTNLTVAADGSGSMELTNYGTTEVHGATGESGPHVSVSVRWTCAR